MVTGCPIETVFKIPKQTPVREIRLSSNETKFACCHIQELIQKKAVTPSKREDGDFVSPVFLCPKKDGGYRMILNLKQFNKYAEHISFKMETLQHILHMVHFGWYMTSIDITDAFLTVPVKKAHRILLKFVFEGNVYMYLVLPFGYTGSLRIFTKILKPLLARLRSWGLSVSFYLDDSWQGAPTYWKCLHTCFEMFRLLQACGFIPKISKCTLVPSPCIEILGVIVNSISMTVSLPKSKELKILDLITLMLRKKFVTARELAKIIGKLLSSTVVCPLGTLYYRSLEKAKLRGLRLNSWDWNCRCKLDEDCYSELKWWLSNLPNSIAPIHRPNPHLTVFSDACSTRWGGYFQGQYAQGHFSEGELPLSINTKETLAIYYTFRSFLHQLKGNHILLQSDNTTAISYVCKMGGMQSELRTKIVTDLWHWAVANDCWLSISHVTGIDNVDADLASRVLNE